MLFEIVVMIVDTAATLVAAGFLLRFWLQVVRVRPPEQLGRPILALSNWFVLPVRRLIRSSAYDWASLAGAALMALVAVLPVIAFSPQLSARHLLLLSLSQFCNWVIYGFMIMMVLEAILSWVKPHGQMSMALRAMNEPLLGPLRRLIPSLGGLDLSVLVALILLRVALQLLTAALASLA